MSSYSTDPESDPRTDESTNFFNQSISSYALIRSPSNNESKPLSDTSIDYDNSQVRFDPISENESSENDIVRIADIKPKNEQRYELRYLKNDITRSLSSQMSECTPKRIKIWKKASNKEVITKLKTLKKHLLKGENSIEIFTPKSRNSSFKPGEGFISPEKRKKNFINEKKREQYLTFIDMLIRALTRDNWLILRDVYYRSTKVFGSARIVGDLLDDICRTICFNRLDLNIIAVANGSVYGDLTFIYDGNFINCMNSNGVSIPGKQHLVHSFESNAKFILIVEKYTVFHHLIENNIIEHLGPVIMITGNGQPDFSVRMFCHHLAINLNIPVFAFVDCNYYGFQIMTIYKYGSLKMQCENRDLVVPNLNWIGLWPSDCKERNLLGQEMSKRDRSRIKQVLERPFMRQHPRWKDEMKLLLQFNQKVEIQSLFDYDCESSPVAHYIREKLMMYDLI